MKKRIAATLAVFLAVGLFIFISKPNENCINLYIDYGSLNENAEVLECIESSGKTNALNILRKANYKIEGTVKYGEAVVCRVNGLPNNLIEKCEDMPPEKAFWAVIIKKKDVIPFLGSEWGWAQKGINETFLYPGDNLGLVFSTNGDLKWP